MTISKNFFSSMFVLLGMEEASGSNPDKSIDFILKQGKVLTDIPIYLYPVPYSIASFITLSYILLRSSSD